MEVLPWAMFMLTLSLLSKFVICKKDRDLYCGVCHVIADEVEWKISQVDPRKTLDVESFRVDPRGNQNYGKKINFARSETHLTEVLEDICEQTKDYAESKDPKTGKRSYVRTSSRDGKGVTLENISMSGEIAKKLKFACESFIEDHEEDIITVFNKETENAKHQLCQETTKICIDEDETNGSKTSTEDEKQKEEL